MNRHRLAATICHYYQHSTTPLQPIIRTPSVLGSRVMNRRLSVTAGDQAPTTPYQDAILHLNSLQSNSATVQKLRENRKLKDTNIADSVAFLQRCNINLDSIDGLNVIHVSGTKGKGSTCAFVESIIRQTGCRTGLYSSPHLIHARERIRINSTPIDEATFAHHFFAVYDQLKSAGDAAPMPAYFKFLTLMAFHVFLAERVDVAVIEVGIGGEYDCTNVIQKPIVCGVSTLDIDHTSLLGTTIKEIAWHKAGIFKTGVPAIATVADGEGRQVLDSRAVEKKTSVEYAPAFSAYTWPCSQLDAGIAGEHQKENISLALQLARTWLRSTGREDAIFSDGNVWQPGQPYAVPETFVTAIQSCRWPGRSQIVETERVRYFLDGAHTPKSMEMCSKWFSSEVSRLSDKRKRILVFQCTADRSPASLLAYLKDECFDAALFCPTILKVSQDQRSDLTNFNQSTNDQLARSQSCAQVWQQLGNKETHVFDCITSLVSWLEETSGDNPLDVLVTGSLHLVGGVLSIVNPDLD